MEAKQMYQWILLVIGTILITSKIMAAEKNQDDRMFEKIFSTWTNAFNHKDLAGSCNLFSPNLSANYQGVPQKNYLSVCQGFKKIFHETRDYQYDFKLHQIYRSNDLAVVRITWYLRVIEQGKLISDTRDEGLDVFQRDGWGNWKIINYLGYPEHAGGQSQ